MPAVSAKQFGLMQAAAHGKLRGKGPSAKVAREFIEETGAQDRSRFARTLAKKRKKKLRLIG